MVRLTALSRCRLLRASTVFGLLGTLRAALAFLSRLYNFLDAVVLIEAVSIAALAVIDAAMVIVVATLEHLNRLLVPASVQQLATLITRALVSGAATALLG